MGNEYRAKVFKSGNSLALRLPKALGAIEGTEMIVRRKHGAFVIEPVEQKPKLIDLTGIAGSIPTLKPLTHDQREFGERELDWEGKLLRRG